MRYKSKMILLYTCFILIVAILIGITYYNYSMSRFREREQMTLEFYSQVLSEQFDSTVNMMEVAINSIVYDINVLNSLIDLSRIGQGGQSLKGASANAALDTLSSKLYMYSLNDFYRVIIFNQHGNAVANRSNGTRAIDPTVTWKDIEWLDQVTGTRGRNVLIGLHRDNWGSRERPVVFSYVKELQGDKLGFIEVQYTEAHLKEIMALPDSEVFVTLQHPSGERMYEYQTGAASNISAVFHSDATNTTVTVRRSAAVVNEETKYIILSTMLICIVVLFVSLVFVVLISSYLTKPIEEIHDMIVHTEYENMSNPVFVRTAKSAVEIEALVDAYQTLMQRLSTSMEKEQQIARLHIKTQFDALQAQVNPHFIFNVLNVISRRGMMDGDDTICEICASLAAILRYSTNMKERLASVNEEFEYLSQYAYLLKSRYEHKFNYESYADDAVRNLLLPKLTIQQLVENCVYHGYNNLSTPMHIRVRAWQEDNKNIIQVRDNGQGFGEKELSDLRQRFHEIRMDLLHGRKVPDLEIGGMGLINVFTRLYLVFGERLSFEVFNDDGAVVRITILDEAGREQGSAF